MSVSTTSTVTGNTSTGALLGGAKKELDRDAFLQLLVAQLSNQDPMSPQDGHEFAAQLAQFSSVEQLTQIGETLGSHTQLLADLANQIGGLAAPAEPAAPTEPAAGDTSEGEAETGTAEADEPDTDSST